MKMFYEYKIDVNEGFETEEDELEFLNDMSENDWELFTIVDCEDYYKYYFKRGLTDV